MISALAYIWAAVGIGWLLGAAQVRTRWMVSMTVFACLCIILSLELIRGLPSYWPVPNDKIVWSIQGDSAVISPLSDPTDKRLYNWDAPEEARERAAEGRPFVMQQNPSEEGPEYNDIETLFDERKAVQRRPMD